MMSYLKHILGAHEEARRMRFSDYKYETEDRVRIDYLYAKKEVPVQNNMNVFVDVKHVHVKKNNVMILCPYIRHKCGVVVGVGEEMALPITSERTIERAVFAVASDGIISRGEVIGAVLFIPVEEVDGEKSAESEH